MPYYIALMGIDNVDGIEVVIRRKRSAIIVEALQWLGVAEHGALDKAIDECGEVTCGEYFVYFRKSNSSTRFILPVTVRQATEEDDDLVWPLSLSESKTSPQSAPSASAVMATDT